MGRMGRQAVGAGLVMILAAGCGSGGDSEVASRCDSSEIAPPSQPGFIVAFDSGDGSEHWRRSVGPVVEPLAVTDRVVVGQSYDGVVQAFEGADGELLWCRDLGSRSGDRLVPSGVVAAGRVVGAIGDDAVFHAFEGATGEALWAADLGLELRAVSAAGERTFYVSSGESDDGARLIALDATSGERRWIVSASECNEASCDFPAGGVPVAEVDETLVIADTAAGGLRGVDVADGTGRWTASLDGTQAGPLSPAGHTVVSLAARPDVEAAVVAVDATTGAVRWSTAVEFGFVAADESGVAVLDQGLSGDDLATGDAEGRAKVIGLTLEEGDERWRTRVPGTPARVEIVGGLVLVADGATVSAFDAASGTERWRVTHAPPTTDAYPEPGEYRGFVGVDELLVGMITPEPPYRD